MEELWQTNEIYQDRIDRENNHHHNYEVKIELYDYTTSCYIECDDRYDSTDDYSIIQKAIDYLDIDEDDIKYYQINVISVWEME